MSCCISPPSTLMDASWWAPHRGAFLNALAAQGYAERTLDTFRIMTGRLCDELDARGLAAEQVDAGVLADLAAGCRRTGSPSMDRDFISIARRFADYPVDSDAIAPMPAPPPPASGSLEQLSAQFDAWPRQHRGMFGRRLRAHRERFGTGLSASAVQTLRKFASFAANRGAEWVTTELFLYWKEQFGSAGKQP